MKSVKISLSMKPVKAGVKVKLAEDVTVLAATSYPLDGMATLKEDVSFDKIEINDIESVETRDNELFRNKDLSEYLKVTIFYRGEHRDLR